MLNCDRSVYSSCYYYGDISEKWDLIGGDLSKQCCFTCCAHLVSVSVHGLSSKQPKKTKSLCLYCMDFSWPTTHKHEI